MPTVEYMVESYGDMTLDSLRRLRNQVWNHLDAYEKYSPFPKSETTLTAFALLNAEIARRVGKES